MKKKNLINLFLAGCIIVILSGISGCAEEKFAPEDCLILKKADADAAWTKDGTLEPIDSILIYTSYLGGPVDEMEARTYGETATGSVLAGTKVDLTRSPECKSGVGPEVHVVRNQVSLAALNITDGSKLKNFEYINFVPGSREFDGRKYLAYQVSVYMDGKWSVPIWSDPCPPLCPIPWDPNDTIPPPPPPDTTIQQR